jgi:hypothetical protein
MGHFRPRRSHQQVRHVGYAPKSGNKIRGLAFAAMGLLWVDGIARHVI